MPSSEREAVAVRPIDGRSKVFWPNQKQQLLAYNLFSAFPFPSGSLVEHKMFL